MLGSREVQKAYLGTQLVWERHTGYDSTKAALVPLDSELQETDNVQYFTTLAELKTAAMQLNTRYAVYVGADSGITKIGNYEFRSYSHLTRIYLPNTVTSIGTGAFYECSGLTEIELPDSVTSVGDYAFYSCGNLKTVKVGNGLPRFSRSTFETCGHIESVTIGNGTVYIQNIFNYAFHQLEAKTAVIEIGSGIVNIDSMAFNNNSYKIKKIILHKAENSVSGAPWGAAGAEIVWMGEE